MVPRSYLYVPGDDSRKLTSARQRGADAVIVDLEDAVASDRKSQARRYAREFVTACAGGDGMQGGPRRASGWPTDVGPAAAAFTAEPVAQRPTELAGSQVWVRVNPPPAMAADIEAVARPGLTGIVVPKAEPEALADADQLLTAMEARQGLPAGGFTLVALVETAAGLLSAAAIAKAPRVVRLGLGEADLVAELGMLPSADRVELSGLRVHLVVASAAAGIAAPVGPVEPNLGDARRLRDSTRALRRLGFGGRTALHPRQLPVINDVFTPSDEEVAQARRTVAALAGADSGVAVTGEGQFVDAAIARSAYRTLTTYESLMRHNEHARGPARSDGGVGTTRAEAATTDSGDEQERR